MLKTRFSLAIVLLFVAPVLAGPSHAWSQPAWGQDNLFDTADDQIKHHRSLAGDVVPEQLAPLLDQKQRNLELAEGLTALSRAHGSDFSATITAAQRASEWQAATLDVDAVDPVPLTGYELPSEALLRVADRYDATPNNTQLDRIHALDGLDAPVAGALARFVDSFLALETATRLAYQDADLEALNDLRIAFEARTAEHPAMPTMSQDIDQGEMPVLGDLMAEAGVDLSRVFPTRTQFLGAVLELQDALDNAPVASTQACTPVQVVPAFSIDLANCDNTYTQDVALQIDAGGSDAYENNAGGGNLAGGACTIFDAGLAASAALVDFGSGDDIYGDPDAPRDCGANGGGGLGVGFLLDAGGDDTYTAGDRATNGGGSLGVGFLLDAAGNDTYTAGDRATNGGGIGGVGFLLDQGGNDTYTAGRGSTNGGGNAGVGLLLDQAGNDTYTAGSFGTNGGGSGGVGFLLDQGGDDTYTAGRMGTNGGGTLEGVGSLLDAIGNDTYTADSYGTNGGGFFGGVGFLLDAGGDDTYTAQICATNGGGVDADCPDILGVPGSWLAGVGSLLDAGGKDQYQSPAIPGGSCWDCTLVPKGLAGTQLDSDDTPP